MRRPLLLVVLCLAVVSVVLASDASADALPKVGFETDSITISESAGSVGFDVSLSPSSALTATVAYTTLDGSALADQDYVAATGTLTFTPGITLQTVFVTVVDDILPEHDRHFSLVLTDPHDAVLGTHFTLTITITDDGDPYVVRMPLVVNVWPVIPFDPTMDTVDNPDGDGAYALSWVELPARQADTYTLQEATNASFTSGLRTVCVTSAQSCDVAGRTAGTYYYHVKGQNILGESGWSNVVSAQVLPPGTPTLSDINNDDGDGSYLVEWSAALRATSYTLQEDDNASFSSPTTVYSGASLSWSATGKLAGTHYYRVRATGPTGTGAWTTTQSVTVDPPGTPVLNSISNEDGDGSYVVTWEAVDEATGYELQEDDNAAFSSPQTVYTGPELTWSASGKLNATYYYRVRATGPTGAGAWSNVESAVVLPPGTPTLDSISNTDGDGSYSVSWSAVTDATGYELQEDDNSTFSSPVTAYSGTGLSWSASGKQAGTYHYRVRATGVTGAGAWSTTRSVTVNPPGTPVLNSIDNADGDGEYTVSWSSVSGATGYELQEDDTSAFSSPATVYTGSGVSWGATGKVPDTYYYRVRALGPTGASSWSGTRSATVPPPPDVRITYIFYDGLEPTYEGDEYATIRNMGSGPVNLDGWRLNAGDVGQDFYFPYFTMSAGQECRVYTDEYHSEWCGFSFDSGSALWRNAGDCGYLYDASGSLVSTYCYP